MIVFMIFLMICLGENINAYEFLCFFVFKMMFYDGFMFFLMISLSLSLHRDLFYVFLNDVLCVFIIFNDGLRCFMFFMFLMCFYVVLCFFCFLKCFLMICLMIFYVI